MIRARIDTTTRIFFPVISGGVFVSGVAGLTAVTVINPQNTASTGLALAESIVSGLYYFDLPNTFMATHGVGMYKYTAVTSAPLVSSCDDIEVYDVPADVRMSVTWDAAANQIRCHSWLQRDGTQDTAGLQNATIRLYDRTGTALAALQTTASPDAQGVFAFNFAAPALAVGETETYFVATIDELAPSATPVRTYRSIVGVTFSRTS